MKKLCFSKYKHNLSKSLFFPSSLIPRTWWKHLLYEPHPMNLVKTPITKFSHRNCFLFSPKPFYLLKIVYHSPYPIHLLHQTCFVHSKHKTTTHTIISLYETIWHTLPHYLLAWFYRSLHYHFLYLYCTGQTPQLFVLMSPCTSSITFYFTLL